MAAHQPRQQWMLLAAIPLVALAGALAAGCSPGTPSGAGATAVASLPGHDSGSSRSGTLTPAQSDQDMIDFTRCMRAHGVQMPDPYHRAGHQGLSLDLPSPAAASRSADSACNHYMEPIIQAKEAGAAERAAPHLAALSHYAQCMRSHDISMLDPNPYGGLELGNVPGITSGFGRYSPQFRAADSACRHLLPAGIHDDGTGP